MSDDPPWDTEGEGSCIATFKGGKGYEEPWLVLRASSPNRLRDRITEAFGLEEGLTLVEAISNANLKFHAISTIRRELGGRVVPSGGDTGNSEAWNTAAAANAEPADPNAALLAEIEAATNPDQLKLFWVHNQPLNEIVKAAWSARGKALKEAGN